MRSNSTYLTRLPPPPVPCFLALLWGGTPVFPAPLVGLERPPACHCLNYTCCSLEVISRCLGLTRWRREVTAPLESGNDAPGRHTLPLTSAPRPTYLRVVPGSVFLRPGLLVDGVLSQEAWRHSSPLYAVPLVLYQFGDLMLLCCFYSHTTNTSVIWKR